jgi:hypothetical protein
MTWVFVIGKNLRNFASLGDLEANLAPQSQVRLWGTFRDDLAYLLPISLRTRFIARRRKDRANARRCE